MSEVFEPLTFFIVLKSKDREKFTESIYKREFSEAESFAKAKMREDDILIVKIEKRVTVKGETVSSEEVYFKEKIEEVVEDGE